MRLPNQQPPVTLIHVGEIQITGQGRSFFVARFKRGALGKAVTRTFWSKEKEGSTIWDRVSPDDLMPLIGQDISAEVSIDAVQIEPEEFISPTTGEVYEITSKAVVRFSDETLEQAVRRSGSMLRFPAEGHPVSNENAVAQGMSSGLPALPSSGAFTVVGLNGQR